jgi:hypothetical protein
MIEAGRLGTELHEFLDFLKSTEIEKYAFREYLLNEGFTEIKPSDLLWLHERDGLIYSMDDPYDEGDAYDEEGPYIEAA